MSGVSVGGGVNTSTQRDIPRIFTRTSVPFILAGGTAGAGTNQFTMGNNGAISTLPVLPTTFSGGAFIYMPANGIFAGSAAGWYWFVASSTTAGTVYNNTYTSGDPKNSIPATPTAFVSTGPGVVTQTTGAAPDIVAVQITIPGNTMGPNGVLRYMQDVAMKNSANGKVHSVTFGGSHTAGGVETTVVWAGTAGTIQNYNATNRNYSQGNQYGPPYGSGTTSTWGTVDTASNQTFQSILRLQTGAETDFIIAMGLTLEVLYGA